MTSSGIPQPLRTFCVIPHLVRDDDAFEAVHEDHIVFDAQGKILTFDFSAVLSPAHNLAHNILSPLFHAISDRRDAALLVSSPGSSGEASTVTLDLFANMLPLLFRAVPAAPIAHISVVEIQRDGKTLTDLYRMTRVHSLQELDTEEVLRASATESWGGVMELMAQRGSWTNDGESAVLILVRLEGFATLTVGDIGASSEILSHVNLTLRSSEMFERSGRTIAPRVPIARLLHGCTTQHGSVAHVVLVPDPMTSPKQTLRLLHFGSNLMKDILLADTWNGARPPTNQQQQHAGYVSIDAGEYDGMTTLTGSSSSMNIHGGGGSGQGFLHDSQHYDSSMRDLRSGAAVSGGGGGSQSSLARRPSSASASAKQPSQRGVTRKAPQPLPTQQAQHQSWRDEIVQGLLAAAPPATAPQQGPTPAVTPRQRQDLSASSMLVITPSQREQELAQKVTTLDRIAKDQKQKILALQNELKRTQGELSEARTEAESRTAECANHKLEVDRARKEQKEAGELVATLLKRISGMEMVSSTENSEANELRRRNEELTAASRKLEDQLTHTIHKVRSLEKKEVLRLRESTLDRIVATSPARGAASSTKRQSGGGSAKTPKHEAAQHGKKLSDANNSIAVEEKDSADVTWDQNSLLHSIKQMRDRCAKLESENHDLRLKHQQEDAFRHAMALMGSGGDEAHHSVVSPQRQGGLPSANLRPRGMLGELHKRMQLTDEEDEVSSPPTSPLQAPGAHQHRVSQYLEKERALLKKQVQQFTEEISRVQKDKDELQQLLALHPSRHRHPATTDESAAQSNEASHLVAEVVQSVAHSLTSGCQSLIVQLQVILSSDAVAASMNGGGGGARPSPRPSSQQVVNSYAQGLKKANSGGSVGTLIDSQTKLLITQHTQALHGIKNAIDDIVGRRPSWTAVPSTATATDCESLSHLLTFEVERLTHLRAFIPTFGQLCVAVEHIKMRSHAPPNTSQYYQQLQQQRARPAGDSGAAAASSNRY